MYGLTVLTPPTVAVVALDAAKVHLRVEHDAENDLIAGLIEAARELTEEYCGKRWYEQTLRLTLPGWPYEYPIPGWLCDYTGGYGAIRLPVEPVTAVTSVKYYATNGILTTLDVSSYQVLLEYSPPLVAPAPQTTWPVLEIGRLGPVRVEFVVGLPEGGSVPARVEQAVLLTLGYWYEHRGDSRDPTEMMTDARGRGLPIGAKRLLDSLSTGAYL